MRVCVDDAPNVGRFVVSLEAVPPRVKSLTVGLTACHVNRIFQADVYSKIVCGS